MRNGRHDPQARRRALRAGREKGCRVYIPAEWLEKAGIDPEGPAPFYRLSGGKRGRYVVTLYAEGDPTYTPKAAAKDGARA